jgi:hypothetical protein
VSRCRSRATAGYTGPLYRRAGLTALPPQRGRHQHRGIGRLGGRRLTTLPQGA